MLVNNASDINSSFFTFEVSNKELIYSPACDRGWVLGIRHLTSLPSQVKTLTLSSDLVLRKECCDEEHKREFDKCVCFISLVLS